MTKPTRKKMTTPSSLAAKATSQQGQSTLQKAWDKKAERVGSSSTPTPKTVPDTPTVLMIENTPLATDATDATMSLPPEPWSPSSPDKRASTLSKRLKATSDDVLLESSPSMALPQLTDTDNAVSPNLPTPAPKSDPSAQQVPPPTVPTAPSTNSSPPASPPISKPRGRPPPTPPQLSTKAVTPSARAATPPRSNRTRPADIRFELRLTVPASSPDDAFKAMTDTISKILAKIWESDKKSQVVPWYNDSKAPPLKRVEDIPTTISAIRQYFPRLTPNSKGGTKFSSIRLRLSIPAATLKEDIDWYLRDNKHSLYTAQIKAETVDTILWLLWSHDMIDTDALRLSIEAHVANAMNVEIPIGLRWRIIQLDQPGRIPEDEAVKALHIDVARKHRTIAKQALEEIYSSKQVHWPLHIRMRAIPLLRDVMNGQVKKDIHSLIGRQASFNDEELGKCRINTWEIKELDFLSPDDYTLRNYIMSIRHPTDPKKSLFHSVDHLHFNRSTVVFTCMPSVEAEARNMVSCLLTFLNHLFGDVVNEFFTKDAQLQAAGSYWDEEEQCVRNEDDAHVASLADIDKDYHLPPLNKKGKTVEQTVPLRPEPTAMSLQRNTFGEEEDSVGTFRREQANTDTVSLSSTIISDSTESIAHLPPGYQPWKNFLPLTILLSLPLYRPRTVLRCRPTTGRAATISETAGHVASWQRLLNGYLLSGGMGQQGQRHGRRRVQTVGRGEGRVITTDTFRQRDLHGNILRNMEDFWGDPIRPKEENHLRVVFQNINRFPMYSSDPKNETIRACLKGIQADIVGMVELGICWHQLPTKDRLWERTRGWFEALKLSLAYNKKEPLSQPVQWGGTAVWSINKAVHRAIESGEDSSGLGRWTWTRYRGRGNVTLRVISAYRPCKSSGPCTVYAQHQTLFDTQDIEGCPRDLFTQHLLEDMEAWPNQGDQLILMIDANEDIRSFQKAIQHTGMREALLHWHGNNAPATFDGGSDPIDGIFVSPSIDIIIGGYFEFGFCPFTDHRGLWMDIHYHNAFGHVMPPVITAPARRLKIQDPRTVKKYTNVWSKFIVEYNNMLDRAYQIQRGCTYPLAPSLQAEMEELDTLRRQGVLLADKQCRKLPMGAVPWSPQVQRARERVEIWGLIIKRKAGYHISSSLLQRQMLSLHIVDRIQDITFDRAVIEKRAALKEYRELKKSSWSLRQTHLEELAAAKAAGGYSSKASALRQLKTHEHQWAMACRVRYVYGSSRAGGVTSVIAPDDDGVLVEMTSKSDMERAIITENESKFLQAMDTPFMQAPLLGDFGYLGIGPHAEEVMKGTYDIPDSVDSYTKQFFQHLKMEQAISLDSPIRTYFTTEEWKQGWRKAKERTSSASDFLYFGHFKAGCTNDIIANFETTMANIPILSGYIPKRWSKAVDCMLLKKPGEYPVDKLLTIVLFDPEANHTFKFLGCAVMAHAEKHNQLPEEQYGSRKRKNCYRTRPKQAPKL